MGKIDNNLRWEIVRKMEKENNQRKLSKELNISQTTIRKIWMKFIEYGSIENRPKLGRNRILSDREERILCRVSKKNPFESAASALKLSNISKPLSISSARRYLRRNNLFGRIAVKKPMLNKGHIQKRLAFCKAYLHWTQEMWDNVIFSDESQFVRYSLRRRYVRRMVGNRFQSQYVCRTVMHGGFSIMVWGAIKSDGSRTLSLCPPKVNSISYQQILRSSLPELLEGSSIFMQDGAPTHRSSSTAKFTENMGLCLISDWPPNSPDINVIENLWAIVKLKVSQKCPRNKDELWQVVQEEWESVDNLTIKKLYGSIRQRLLSVTKNKGYHIKY